MFLRRLPHVVDWPIFLSAVDLFNVPEAELEHLFNACDPATFGVEQQDILDESYRKAGKMELTDFATKFVVGESGLMDVIRSELLEGHKSTQAIKTELYKLNVYGLLFDGVPNMSCCPHQFTRKGGIFQVAQRHPSQ